MFKVNGKFYLFLVILLLLIIIPVGFAHENDTVIMVDNESSIPIEASQGDDVLAAGNDYYFDASAIDDSGNGSIDNPYKYLTASRIKANANIHLANGEYRLDAQKSIEQVNFIGSDANQTIIKYDGVAFKVWNTLTLANLTISDATIENYANLNATNTIFAYGYGSNPDGYGNNFGGAIYCPYYSSSYTSCVNIKNCTFSENYAEYGGAIYMEGGSLDIIDTMFINNFAYNYGGAIAGEFGAKITVSRSKFFNSYSMADAGGAIYTREATLKVENVDIVNSSSTIGGAITSLKTDVSLNYLTVKNCSAKWDGGAIYHMYGNFSSTYGEFSNNSANNGGALFIDNSTNLFLRSNSFSNNNANLTAGAIYSICNILKGMTSFKQFNRFTNNSAFFKDDDYVISSINLTIGNGNYTMYKNNASEVTDLPSYYSLRDYNLLTIPKDQQSSGNCWAFTAISVLESAILKATGESFDFSEENMKNVIAQFSDYGWNIETNDGGYDNMPIAYLVSWLGPVNDSDDVFDDHGTLSPILDSLMHVQNVLFLKRDNYLDNDAIKKAIMQYGAVGTSMLYDSSYFGWEGYYCWYNDYSNHAVTIVGWDDNYSRNNFYGLSQDKGNGAWIVRNSWGPDWNGDGYFYVSYYDAKLAQPGVDNIAYTFILNDTVKYDRNYQYDIAGQTDFLYNGEDTIWYKNVFKAENNEFLAGISTYFEKITNWTASVYVNGEIRDSIEGISNPGYYTFDLGKMIPLSLGDEFEVEFKVSRSDLVSFPIHELKPYINKLTYGPGISYISMDGQNWIDLYNLTGAYATHTYTSQVACIKAFTIFNEINTITNLTVSYDGFNLFNITALVTDQYGNLLKNGNVTFNINGDEYVVDVVGGIAEISHMFDEATMNISATFNAVGYNSSFGRYARGFDKTHVDLNLNISQYENDVNITVSTLDTINDPITIIINNETSVANLTDGRYVLNLTLSNGFYVIEVSLDTLIYESNATANFTVKGPVVKSLPNITVFNQDCVEIGENVNLTLKSDAEGAVEIFIDGRKVTDLTIAAGITNVSLGNLSVGGHYVELRYLENEIYLPTTLNSTITVNKRTTAVNAESSPVMEGETLTIDVEVSDDATGVVLVDIGSNKYYGIIEDGKASINVSDLKAGNYIANITYIGDDKFYNASSSLNVNITPKIEPLTPIVNVTVSSDNSFAAINLPSNATGNVTVKVDGRVVVDVILSNGAVNVLLGDLACGNHIIEVIYYGDDKYACASEIKDIFIAKAESTVSALPVEITEDEVAVICVNVTDGATGIVLVDISGNKFFGEIDDDKAIVNAIGLAAGNYTAIITYGGDDKYSNASTTVDVKVKAKEEPVIPEPETNITVVVDCKEYNATVVNGTAVVATDPVDINITVVVDGKEYPAELVNGTAVVVTDPVDINITVVVDGKEYPAELVNGTAVVATDPVDINITVVVDGKEYPAELVNGTAVVATDPVDINITVVVDGKEYPAELVNGTVSVVTDKEKVETNVTVVVDGKEYSGELVNGTVSVTTDSVIPSTVVVDGVSYPLVVVNGTASVTTNQTEPVKQIGTIIESEYSFTRVANDYKVGERGDLFYAVLKDINGNPLANMPCKVAVNGPIYDVVTDSQGRFGVQVNLAAANTYTYALSFLGNDQYGASFNSSKLILVAKKTSIAAKDQTFKAKAKTKTVSVTLQTVKNPYDGKTYLKAGKKIALTVNGKTYTAKTNANGVAKFSIKLTKKGKYSATIKFAGDKTYNASSKKVKINIK